MAQSDSFYSELKMEVDEVLAEFGTSYTIRGTEEYDSDALEAVAGESRSVSGLVADQTTATSIAGDAGVDRGVTWIGIKTLILSATALPAKGEEIQVDGKWYPLSKLVPIKPADILVVYMMDVTR